MDLLVHFSCSFIKCNEIIYSFCIKVQWKKIIITMTILVKVFTRQNPSKGFLKPTFHYLSETNIYITCLKCKL